MHLSVLHAEGSGLTVRADGGASRWLHAFALANEPLHQGSVPDFREETKKAGIEAGFFCVTCEAEEVRGPASAR